MKRIYSHNSFLAFMSLVLIGALYFIHAQTSPHNALSRALGDVSFIYLAKTLSIGPLARLIPSTARFVIWRRTFGVWFFLIGAVHAGVIMNLWFGWSIVSYLGFVSEGGIISLTNSGLGIANLLGTAALFLGLILAATSFDKAILYLGPKAWKWLHSASYTIFALLSFHVLYFTFFYYAENPSLLSPTRYFLLALIIVVPFLQAIGFSATVMRERVSRDLPDTTSEHLTSSHEAKLLPRQTVSLSKATSSTYF